MDDFDTWWNEYPRKVSKGQARKAYSRAIKLVDAKVLLEGVKRYKSEREHEDPRYTKHPATWLNGECWEDSPCAKMDASFGGSDRDRKLAQIKDAIERKNALADKRWAEREAARLELPLPDADYRPTGGVFDAQVEDDGAVEGNGFPI